MDSDKVRMVTDWPELMTVKELQQFLEFTNFYHQLIQNYSSIGNPLTYLLQAKPRQLQWSKQSRTAFTQLKKSFTTAPILRHTDPSRPFIMELDANSNLFRVQ